MSITRSYLFTLDADLGAANPLRVPTLDLDVRVGSAEDSLVVRATLDLSAPVCVFDQEVAATLGIHVNTQRERARALTVEGALHLAAPAEVTLGLGHLPEQSWTTEAWFWLTDSPNAPGGVLGLSGFLDRWVLSVDVGGGYFLLQDPIPFRRQLPLTQVAPDSAPAPAGSSLA